MKKLSFILAVAFVIVAMCSCEKSVESQLVGTWSYEAHKTFNGDEFVINGVRTLNEDGTSSDSSTYTLKGVAESDGTQIIVKLAINSTSDWQVEDKDLTDTPKSCTGKVISIMTCDPANESDTEDLASSNPDLYNAMKSKLEKQMHEEGMEAASERITDLQKDKFATEEDCDNGEKVTITFNRINK